MRVRGSILMKLVSIAANPVPEGATVGTVKTSDGVVLRFARFDPPAGRKGTLCVFTGRAEFIEKYFEVVRDARARGFAVAMLDWRGQGFSDRALPNARKGHREFCRVRPRSGSLRQGGRAAGLPPAAVRAGAFNGGRGADSRRTARATLVRPHCGHRTDDRTVRRRRHALRARQRAVPAD